MSLGSALNRRISFSGIAIAGVVAGHCLAHRFFAVSSGPHAHHHATHSHGPWMLAVAAGLLIALAGSFIDHRLGARRIKLATKAGMLLAVQMTGFILVSLVDRVTDAAGTEIGSRPFWAGIVLQVIAALLGALALAFLRTAVATIEKLIHRAHDWKTTPSVLWPFSTTAVRVINPLALAVGGPTFRGPPLHL